MRTRCPGLSRGSPRARAIVRVHISGPYLPQGAEPYTKRYQHSLSMQRARYPKKRRADGAFFTEEMCPSCGANFVPDNNHCCSLCGYTLQHDLAKRVMEKAGI